MIPRGCFKRITSNLTKHFNADSVTDNNLAIPKDVVLQVWVNPAQLAAKKGYKIIASHASFWYLDCGHGGWT